jgi:hypothetical protein
MIEAREDCPKDAIVFEKDGKPVGAIVGIGRKSEFDIKKFRELMLKPLPREF